MNLLIRSAAAIVTLTCSLTPAEAQCRAPSFLRTEGSGVVRFSRAVNDVRLSIGNQGIHRISELSARVVTNCGAGGFDVWLEVYASTNLNTPSLRIGHVRATSVIATGRSFTVEGRTLAEYVASARVPAAMPIRSKAGSRIWLGAYVHDTFSFSERGYAVADTSKPSSSRPPMIRASSTGSWTSAPLSTCDLAVSATTMQLCRADFNEDGRVDGLDHAAFTTAWLAGDPSANFDGVGGVTNADLAAFATEYFRPCSPVPGTY